MAENVWLTCNNDIKTYENIRKHATCQGDHYTSVCLLDYPYFKKYISWLHRRIDKEMVTESIKRMKKKEKWKIKGWHNHWPGKSDHSR